MFGIPIVLVILLAMTAIYLVIMIYSSVRAYLVTRRGRRNYQAIVTRTNEIAAEAHADAERMVALLTEIRDRLDKR